MTKVAGLIPARYASTRLPGKVLAPILGIQATLYCRDEEGALYLPEGYDESTYQVDIARAWLGGAEHPDTGEKFLLVYDKQGEQFNEAAKFEDAIAEFEKAIVIDPRKADAYINLGYALHMSMQTDEALEVFEQAYEYAPDNEVLIEERLGDLERLPAPPPIPQYRPARAAYAALSVLGSLPGLARFYAPRLGAEVAARASRLAGAVRGA